MIAIVGNIKVDESKPERIKYLIACIRSYLFLKDHCKFVLALHGNSEELYDIIHNELRPFNHRLVEFSDKSESYGHEYIYLLNRCADCNFVINFMEDQFMVCDDTNQIMNLLSNMDFFGVDVCKASFFKVEQNSIAGLKQSIFENNLSFHTQYQKHYGTRYYIGVNFITTLEFAKKFWNRDLGKRPHEYEIAKYDEKWFHTVMFPIFPVMETIDDDHGEPGTALLNRSDCEKWNKIWRDVVFNEQTV